VLGRRKLSVFQGPLRLNARPSWGLVCGVDSVMRRVAIELSFFLTETLWIFGTCLIKIDVPEDTLPINIVLPGNTVESVDSGTDSAGSVTDNAEDDAEGDQSWGVISMISGVFGLLFGMGDVTDRQLEPTERETIADDQITVVSEFATAPGTVGSETASIVEK
jgi:hypothetical protein